MAPFIHGENAAAAAVGWCPPRGDATSHHGGRRRFQPTGFRNPKSTCTTKSSTFWLAKRAYVGFFCSGDLNFDAPNARPSAPGRALAPSRDQSASLIGTRATARSVCTYRLHYEPSLPPSRLRTLKLPKRLPDQINNKTGVERIGE